MNEPNPLPTIHTLICFAAHHSVAFVVIKICLICENDPGKKSQSFGGREKKKGVGRVGSDNKIGILAMK